LRRKKPQGDIEEVGGCVGGLKEKGANYPRGILEVLGYESKGPRCEYTDHPKTEKTKGTNPHDHDDKQKSAKHIGEGTS